MIRIAVPALLLVLAACGTAEVPGYTIKVDDRYLPVLNLDVTIAGDRRDGSLVEAAGAAVKKVADDMAAGKPPARGTIEAINFTFRGPPRARSATGDRFMHLSINGDALRDGAGRDADAIMADATEVGWWTPSNDDVINSYCARHPQGDFCRKFVPL